jgi:hypothetical protein
MQPDWWIQYALQGEESPETQKLLRECIRFSLADHLFSVMNERFTFMKELRRIPSAVQHVAELLTGSKNTGSLYRKFAGKRPVTFVEFLALASMLEVEPKSLVPAKNEWLSYALWRFCRRVNKDLVSMGQAELFVDFCLEQYVAKRATNEASDDLDRSSIIAEIAERRNIASNVVESAVDNVEVCFGSL